MKKFISLDAVVALICEEFGVTSTRWIREEWGYPVSIESIIFNNGLIADVSNSEFWLDTVGVREGKTVYNCPLAEEDINEQSLKNLYELLLKIGNMQPVAAVV